MIERALVLGALVVSLASPALAGDPPPPRGPVSIFVRARADETRPPDTEMDARKTKANQLHDTFKRVEKDLKKSNGKDRKKWPAEAKAAWIAARDASGMAWSANYYVARPATEKADSVADLQEKLGKDRKVSYTSLARSAEDADLIVEIVGRKGEVKFMAGAKYMAFDLLPGKISGATLAQMPSDFTPWLDDNLWSLHWPTTAEPFARFEVMHEQRWSDVAGYARETLEELVKENYALLKP